MVSKGSANSQIPELNNSDVYFGSLCPLPKDLMQDRRWRDTWSVHSPMCLEHGQESLVHLFPFWDFYQRLQEKPLQKGPVLMMRPAVAPPGGHLLMERVLGDNFTTAKSTDRTPEMSLPRAHSPAGSEPVPKAALPATRAALRPWFQFFQGLSWTHDCIPESGG